MKNNEGIDKIKVILNPLVLNKKMIHFNKKHIMHIHPHNYLTLHEGGAQVCLAIHYEYIIQSVDIILSIAYAIGNLIEKGIVFNFSESSHKPISILSIFSHISDFIIHVPQIEFFFNMKEENITVKEESVAFGYLRKIFNRKSGAVSFYSNDYRHYRDSMIIIYNKATKETHDNHKSNIDIMNNPYKVRLEFRLNNINCKRLHINNLHGRYNQIIRKFIPFLAIKYNALLANHVEINPVDNPCLAKLLDEAKKQEQVKRYTGKELEKTTPFPKCFLRPHQIENREEKSEAFLEEISKKAENDINTGKLLKIEEKLKNKGVL